MINIRLKENGFHMHAKLFNERVIERIPVEFTDKGMTIEFCIDSTIGEKESYWIVPTEDGFSITGADELGLYYGIGKFLHSAKWSEQNFVPNPPTGVVTPACDFRAIYFAVHFYNWYQMASEEELERYLEDLLLWGYNTIICIIPTVNIDTFEDKLFVNSINKIRTIFSLGKKYGMKSGLIIYPNQGLKTTPEEYAADMSFNLLYRGNLGRNVCLSNPKGFEYMRYIWRTELEQFVDIGIDYVITWPYDEGGCGCENCRPWGANKYCDGCKGVREEALKLYPNVKMVVSTWAFDAPDDDGEYAGLYKRLKGDMDWVDYLMVDAHNDFPRYALEHEVIKPIINFPEISMWGLFPWGGFGANPLPERFQGFWDSAKHVLKGGMPYSEGIFEDILKVQCSGYYWHPDKHYREILSEYISYEYSWEVIDDALELMRCIEKNHDAVAKGVEPDLSVSQRGVALAEVINKCLSESAKTSWRWRILYIRAILDWKRYTCYLNSDKRNPDTLKHFMRRSGDYLIEDEEAQNLFRELRMHYHCVEHNGENRWTLPPLGGTIDGDNH